MGLRIGEANVFNRHPRDAPSEIARILSALEHPSEPIKGSIRIRAAHRLVQRGDLVVEDVSAGVEAAPLAGQYLGERLLVHDAVAAEVMGDLHQIQQPPCVAVCCLDEAFARAMGIPVRAVGFGLVTVAAIAAVAAFDAVGSIIVISMFICPPAAARLMTNSLSHQVLWSVAFATLSAVVGFVLAGYGPLWLGAVNAVSAAGMIATVSGVILALACIFGPHARRVGEAAAQSN